MADEFLGANAAYGFLKTGKWQRWDFNWQRPLKDKPYCKTFFDFDIWRGEASTYTRAWMYNWQVVQTLKFLPANKESSYRLTSVFWGVLAVLIIFKVAEKLTGKAAIGLLAAFLLAISPNAIGFSRKVRMYAMFMPVFLLFIYFLFLFLESQRESSNRTIKQLKQKSGFDIYYFPIVLLFGLLSMHLHSLTANVIPLILFYWLIMAGREKYVKGTFANKYSKYLAAGLLFGSVLKLLLGTKLVIWNNFLSFTRHFSYFGEAFSDFGSPVLAGGLVLWGSYYLFKLKPEVGGFVSSFFWGTLLLAVFFWNRNVGAQYIFFAKSFQLILLASALYGIGEFFRINLKSNQQKIATAVIAVMVMALINFNYFFSDNGPYKQTSRSTSPNYRKIFHYFKKKKRESDVLITRNFRNFYFANARVTVFSFGGERANQEEKRITHADLQKIMAEHQTGWLIYSDNDERFISKEARRYAEKNLEKVSNASVRGPVSVFRWGIMKTKIK